MVRRRRNYSRGRGCRIKYLSNNGTNTNILALWTLRALVYLKGNKNFINKHGFSDSDILNIIGLLDLDNIDNLKSKHANKLIEARLENIESQNPSHPEDILFKNLEWIGKTLALTKYEREILLFSVLLSTVTDLRDGLNTVTGVDKERLYHCLSVMLDIPIENCKKALNSNSILINTGLIKIEHDERQLGDKIRTLNTLIESIFEDHNNQHDILNKFFKQSSTSTLEISDFQHIKSDYHLISTYLSSVTRKKTPGVNILIYGEPGVGKTEFVKMLTHNINLKLYDISMKNNNGDPINGYERFSVYQLSQKFLEHHSQCCILFDEIEDVFPTPGNSFFGSVPGNTYKSSGKKAWINNLLENNSVPTFWLCNQVNQIDPAYLRCFDYVMELKQPNRAGRTRIINKYLNHLNIDEKWVKDIASNENIAPAFIEKAAKIAEHMGDGHEKSVEKTIDRVLDNTLAIFSHKKTQHSEKNASFKYSIDYINADNNIKSICDGLKTYGSGRLCLYGPPGTGKTALGHHIATHLDKPLLVKRASDILSMWVGGTEENIAKMFQQATDEKAVLLLDEADGFIQSRQSAQHSWEITQVNELLVQMENFDGIFIASTNLIEILDTASLRRFDFKVKFDYLKASSAYNIFNNIINQQNWGETLSETELTMRLQAIPNITFGDFAVAMRKMRFSSEKTNKEFLSHLENEAKLKPGAAKQAIGFSANIH